MTTTYTVRRDGQPDLRFDGESLGTASSKRHDGPKNTRWEEVELFRAASGRYVASVVHRTRWENEHDTFRAIVGAGPLELLQELRDEGEHADVVDLAKEALEEAGVDASEELEDGEAPRAGASIRYAVAVLSAGEAKPHIVVGEDLAGVVEDLQVEGQPAEVAEAIRGALASYLDEGDGEGGQS